MPNFNINDKQGFKIGSIEEQGPGFLDAFEAMMLARGAVRMGQVNEVMAYIDSVHQMFSQTYELLNSLRESKSNIEIGPESEALIPTSERLLETINAAPSYVKQKRYLAYFENTLKAECERATTTVQNVINTIQVLQELNRLFYLVDDYIELHNASCDRLEAEGFNLEEVVDKKFLALNDKWIQESDVILDYFNEILALIEIANTTPRSEFPIEQLQGLLDQEEDMTTRMKSSLVQTEGREIAAKRLLSNSTGSREMSTVTEELQKLVELKEAGHLTDSEFKALKMKLL